VSSVVELARAEIRALRPYEHAAWLPTLERLHANELPWRALADHSQAGLNRYPEPQPHALIVRLAALYGVAEERVLVGRGSDEAIDLLVRAFCRAGQDAVLVCPPTFGMYAVAARIQGANVESVPLRRERGYALDVEALLARCAPEVKLVFLCSPNNPTGNRLEREAMLHLARTLAQRALVVVDEAYLDFAAAPSLSGALDELPNLALLRTLSKAHGLAGARVGVLLAHPQVVTLLRKIIPPYALAQLSIEAALRALEAPQLATTRARVAQVVAERQRLAGALRTCDAVTQVWPSDANFLLVEFADADAALARAAAAGLLLRDCRKGFGIERALRVTVGTPEQNERLLAALA
jgi:histidinol-phosphate aminotransferase